MGLRVLECVGGGLLFLVGLCFAFFENFRPTGLIGLPLILLGGWFIAQGRRKSEY